MREVIRGHILMRFGSLVGVDEDGLDAKLTRPVNIPVHVVPHADYLGLYGIPPLPWG